MDHNNHRLRSRHQHQRKESHSGGMKDESLDLISAEAEARLAAKRQARFEARNMRMKELEQKRQKEDESSPNSGNSNGSNAPVDSHVVIREEKRNPHSYSSRRSSTDSSEDGYNFNVRDLKIELKEIEEKFRKAMVTNAGLDNEKSALTYQLDLLKDRLEESDEVLALVNRELREKNRELELLKKAHVDAKRAVQLLQAQLDEQSMLLTERGFVLIGNGEATDDIAVSEDEQDKRTRGIVSTDTANILSACGSGPLDIRIKRLADERDDLQDVVGRLKLDLEEERTKNLKLERSPFSSEDAEREAKRIIDEYKFKFQKSEQDSATLQTNVARLETQVVRYKTAAETAERSEHELKTERRKVQRELRESQARIDELETTNKHLEARLAKLKTAKSNLLKDL
uniref:Leucine-rich repeat flightless-interacting protein 2 n=1 Tax=Caligus clemensi TaxID=344056 RepID=C1C0K6_CALCM|nr:Leucine-rich repeat flightless-interacting protein 2 [Caligus clemensi]